MVNVYSYVYYHYVVISSSSMWDKNNIRLEVDIIIEGRDNWKQRERDIHNDCHGGLVTQLP